MNKASFLAEFESSSSNALHLLTSYCRNLGYSEKESKRVIGLTKDFLFLALVEYGFAQGEDIEGLLIELETLFPLHKVLFETVKGMKYPSCRQYIWAYGKSLLDDFPKEFSWILSINGFSKRMEGDEDPLRKIRESFQKAIWSISLLDTRSIDFHLYKAERTCLMRSLRTGMRIANELYHIETEHEPIALDEIPKLYFNLYSENEEMFGVIFISDIRD